MGLLDKQKIKMTPGDNVLTKEECYILLSILQETTFKGKDIKELYRLFIKIEGMLTNYENG